MGSGNEDNRISVPDEDNIYVCRCEEVTVGDIKRAIAQGADSIKAIKLRTHAGMGVCQGMTCRRNIERMLREQRIDLDLCYTHTQRFPVRMLNVGDMTGLLEDEDIQNETDGAAKQAQEEIRKEGTP